MATRKVTLTGNAYWAKVQAGKEDMGWNDAHIDSGGVYSVELELTPDQEALLMGAKSAAQKNKQGRYKLKRKVIEKFDWLPGGTPQVVMNGEPYTDIIPNGSKVQVKATVYDTQGMPGTRLEAINILELAEMDEGDSWPDVEQPEEADGVPF